jgi:ornithine cyclodeaminase/alanine dehydrogenase-like protein (mu-crystallin family)
MLTHTNLRFGVGSNFALRSSMNKILVLTHAEVEQLLPMAACIELMAQTLSSLSRGEMLQPLRMVVRPSESRGLLAMMPAYSHVGSTAYGLKAICVFPDNAAKGMDAHQGGVLLFSGETGELRALINASAITEIRTAAVSAVATRALSRDDPSTLAIIGAGVQARSHLAALACVREIKNVKVVSRTLANAERFVVKESTRYEFPIKAVGTPEEALNGADLIVTVTTSHEPVVQRKWITEGAHINAVGTYSAAAREIDTSTMAAARVFVDRRESALNEAGDYLLAAREGAIGPEHIKGELGEVLNGKVAGRQSAGQITLFKSLGLAVEDLAAAEYVFTQAQKNNAGSWVNF